jgi:hypothetical protein
MITMDDAYALVIGISQYAVAPPLPPSVARDARELYRLLIDPHCGGYPPENTALLCDGAASRAALLQHLARLAEDVVPDSTVLIYIAACSCRLLSGARIEEYLLPADVRAGDELSLAETAIAGSELARALFAIRARAVIMVLDDPATGGLPLGAAVAGFSPTFFNALKAGRGRFVLVAPQPAGASGSLTQYLLAGLRGGAPANGVIGILSLYEYLVSRMTPPPALYVEIEENIPIMCATPATSATSAVTTTTAGRLRVTLTHTNIGWSLVTENTGDQELTSVSVTLRPPPALFLNNAVIDIPRLPAAGGTSSRALVLHAATARPAGETVRSAPISSTSSRLIERERARLEARIAQLMDTIDRLQEERDVAGGLARLQLDQQIERQKQTLEQYERDMQQIDARAQSMAATRDTNATGPPSAPVPPAPQMIQLPFVVMYRVANARVERVEGMLAIALP